MSALKPSSSEVHAVSAPGKVLLVGGYLILDRKYNGLVIGLNARIHAHVSPISTTEGVTLQEIIVRSPQFKSATWRYGYNTVPEGGGIRVTQLKSASEVIERNPFIETALTYTLTYISTVNKPAIFSPVVVTILADDDYYSKPEDTKSSSSTVSKSKKSRFTDFNIPLLQANKTGLGSSAALVTAFIGAILVQYLPPDKFSLESDEGKKILHNLAQVAHCSAQGKVGSGFDVASAVFGSCIYRRFSPSYAENVSEAGGRGFAEKLSHIIEGTSSLGEWDTEIRKTHIKIPDGLRLVMCDVDCGSKTPGMVKKVLEWRKQAGTPATYLWDSIQHENDRLANAFTMMNEDGENHVELIGKIIERNREVVRFMSAESGVPIEPEPQTLLLDACTALDGVVGGVVPGAGGYDAVALLIEDRDEVLENLTTLLVDWKFATDESAVRSSGNVRLLGVREEKGDGVRVENTEDYQEWVK